MIVKNELWCEIANTLGEWAGKDGEVLLEESKDKKVPISRIDDSHYQVFLALQCVGGEFWLKVLEGIDEEMPSMIMPFAPNRIGTITSCIVKFIETNI